MVGFLQSPTIAEFYPHKLRGAETLSASARENCSAKAENNLGRKFSRTMRPIAPE
jgi:hypothetical protein